MPISIRAVNLGENYMIPYRPLHRNQAESLGYQHPGAGMSRCRPGAMWPASVVAVRRSGNGFDRAVLDGFRIEIGGKSERTLSEPT